MRRLSGLLLWLAPLPAMAVEMDFYTYNGFEETVGAFQRLALIFSDNRILIIAGILAALGLVLGAGRMAYKGLSGQESDPRSYFMPLLIGVAVFKGAVIPTGTVHVFDPVRNGYEPVGGVPVLVLVVAGVLNKIERAMIDVVDTASAGVTFAEVGGPLEFSLAKAAVSSDVEDWYLQQSAIEYYLSCGRVAMGGSDGGNMRQRLMHDSSDLMDSFAEWQNNVVTTIYYPPGNDEGEVRSCRDAWSGTNGLQARLTNASTFAAMTESICEQAGFNMSDGAQDAQCRTALQDTALLYEVPIGNELPFLRSVVLAEATAKALNSDDYQRSVRTLSSRAAMAEGLGAAEALNEWVPKIRAFMLAVVLGLAPIMLVLIVTPLIGPAIVMMAGLLLWVTLWGISDGIAHQMLRDMTLDAWREIARNNFGVQAILMTPEGAVKALATYGKGRGVALMMATVLSYGIFKVGGFALASLAGQFQGRIEGLGEQAGRQSMLPEEQAGMSRSLFGAPAAAGAAAQGFGTASMGMGGGMDAVRGFGAANQYIDERQLGGGSFMAAGAADTAGTLGRVKGLQAASTQFGAGGATEVARTEAAIGAERGGAAAQTIDSFGPGAASRTGTGEGIGSFTSAGGTVRAAEEYGTADMEQAAFAGRGYDVERARATEEAAGGDLPGGIEQVSRQDVASQFGRAQAAETLAANLGMDPGAMSDRVQIEQAKEGARITMPVTDETRDGLMQYLGDQGALSAGQMAMMESRDGSVSFPMGPDGTAGAAQFNALSEGQVGASTRVDYSATQDYTDRTSYGDSEQIIDPLYLRNDAAVDTLKDVLEGDPLHQLDRSEAQMLARTYAERMEGEGLDLDASAYRSEQDTFQGALGIGSISGVGAGGQAGTTVTTQDDARQDPVITGMADTVRENLTGAQDSAIARYGDPSQWDADTREAALDHVASYWHHANEGEMNQYESGAMERTERPADLADEGTWREAARDGADSAERGFWSAYEGAVDATSQGIEHAAGWFNERIAGWGGDEPPPAVETGGVTGR
jgi:hypothetical protein